MAETSSRTLFSCCLTLTLLISFSKCNSNLNSGVTFLGYLNDPEHRTFSALLQVDVFVFDSNADSDHGFSDYKQGHWLAVKDSKLCNDVYGIAKVESDAENLQATENKAANSAECNYFFRHFEIFFLFHFDSYIFCDFFFRKKN